LAVASFGLVDEPPPNHYIVVKVEHIHDCNAGGAFSDLSTEVSRILDKFDLIVAAELPDDLSAILKFDRNYRFPVFFSDRRE